jgi:cytochrome c553
MDWPCPSQMHRGWMMDRRLEEIRPSRSDRRRANEEIEIEIVKEKRGTTLFRKLAITALFIMTSAGLPALAAAQGNAAAGASADLDRGEQLFQLCTQCHGANGQGNADALAPSIAGLPSWYLEGQLQKFKSGMRGMHPGDTGGLRMYPMSLWLRDASDQRDVAAYVSSLPRAEFTNELETHGDAAKGAGYYAVCSACHMADASGNQGMGAPPLTGMSDWYLFSAIQKYKAGVRGNGPGDALGPAMIGMVATLPDNEAILDVIAHIQALGK